MMNKLLSSAERVKARLQEGRNARHIQSSPLFDATWYLANHPDVAQAKVDPALHYLRHGGFEGRDPGPEFSSGWYLDSYADVKKAGINPLVHYLRSGRDEGRHPNAAALVKASGLFDWDWYLAHYPDVARANVDPLHHYLQYGGSEGRDPGPNFSSKGYLAAHEDVARSRMNPLVHYLGHGGLEQRATTASARGGPLPALVTLPASFSGKPELVESILHLAESLSVQPQLAEVFRQLAEASGCQSQSIYEQLAQLPVVLRGLAYSGGWSPSTINLTSHLAADPASTPHLNELQTYADAHKEGRGIWKWNHYFDIYERHFRKFVGREVHILEIGIYSGGSLEMWRHYFGPKCHIYGVDIEAACRVYENDYTKILIGDQADREFWKRVRQEVPKVDIVVDDGGHQTEQQIVTLEELLPHLSPGGIYLCEDIHGLHNAFASYMHGLVKSLNEIHGDLEDGFINVSESTQFQSWIRAIDFYPYIAVIEKSEMPARQLTAPKRGTDWQPFYDGFKSPD